MKEEQGSTLKQSDEKSVVMDLMQFKELDAHALKVDFKDSVENLVSVLHEKAHSDLEKVRAIWMWICHHIEYDVEGYRNRDKAFYKPADVLQSGKAICCGYARLFEEMCRVAGILCKYLVGRSRNDDFKGKSRHAWNAVYLDGKWHLLDCTWASGYVDDSYSKFTFSYKEFYFLTSPALFRKNHFPDEDVWQLLKQKLDIKYLVKWYLGLST